MDFQQINLMDQLQRALADAGYVEPTPIQIQTIPPALEGKDILGCAQTGTGKTAAFALPILNALGQKNRKATPYRPKALVLAPTRELVIQIGKSFDTYGTHLFLRHTLIYGGVSEVRQIKAMKRGAHIVIATPGRLIDLLQQDALRLDELKYFVLDEADRMLDMGFQPDLERIMAELPEQRQSLFFSATIDKKVAKLAGGLLRDSVRVDIAPEYPAVETVSQHLCYVENSKKRPLLLRLLHELTPGQTMVFVNKKHTADKLTGWLNKKGFKTDTIHGNKRQTQRERIMNKFRKENVQILVATDVASRGIDIDGITHVFNYDLPFDIEDYVHRIGRTGRAGAEGIAISFCATHEKGILAEIEKLIGFPIDVFENRGDSYHQAITAVKGSPAQASLSSTEENVVEDKEDIEDTSQNGSTDTMNEDESAPVELSEDEITLEDNGLDLITPDAIDSILEPEPTDELSALLEIPMTEGQQNKPKSPIKRSLRRSDNPPTSENNNEPRKIKVRPTPKRARISEGEIVKLSPKGFGFIKTKTGKELYFHMTSVFGRWRFDSLGEGQRVSYKRVKTDKGHIAEGVKGLEEPPEKPRRFGGRDSRGGERGRRSFGDRRDSRGRGNSRRDGGPRGRRRSDGDGDSRSDGGSRGRRRDGGAGSRGRSGSRRPSGSRSSGGPRSSGRPGGQGRRPKRRAT